MYSYQLIFHKIHVLFIEIHKPTEDTSTASITLTKSKHTSQTVTTLNPAQDVDKGMSCTCIC